MEIGNYCGSINQMGHLLILSFIPDGIRIGKSLKAKSILLQLLRAFGESHSLFFNF